MRRVRFAAGRESFVELDLGWEGAIVASEALSLWETQPLAEGPLTLRDVLERHGAEVWLPPRDLADSAAAPSASSCRRANRQPRRSQPARAAESRPEYYDFDLFRYGDSARELHERRLSDLAYTVFDTETTGLEPSVRRSSASEPCGS